MSESSTDNFRKYVLIRDKDKKVFDTLSEFPSVTIQENRVCLMKEFRTLNHPLTNEDFESFEIDENGVVHRNFIEKWSEIYEYIMMEKYSEDIYYDKVYNAAISNSKYNCSE